MTNDTLKKQLSSLGADYLAEKLVSLSESSPHIAEEIEVMLLKNDPKKLAKKINSQIYALKRSKRFVEWNRTNEITDPFEQVMRAIENDLLPQDPELAINLVEKLFDIDQCIFERVDDSGGQVGMLYYALSELWGKAWFRFEKRDNKIFVEKIYQLLLKNEYGVKDKVIAHSVSALGKSGLILLEKLIQKNENKFGEHTYPWIYKAIADGLGDVDKYIEIVKKHSVINDITVCDIAKRLIAKWRSQEAIDWLLYKPNDITVENSKTVNQNKITHSNSDRCDLLLEAYESETLLDEAQSLRWILFKRTLSYKYYEGLIKHKVGVELEKIKEQAFQFACDQCQGSVGTVLRFLSEISAYEKIDEVVQEKFDTLSEDDYYLYRPLSKTLFASGFSLSACLLRRKLIDGILNRAISKYYKYAVSDLKLSAAYAKEVKDWKSFQNHDQYMENLRINHARKSAFWAQVKESD